ncbi:hypothetical protein ACS0TY_000986 [Phlomoides rotata]
MSSIASVDQAMQPVGRGIKTSIPNSRRVWTYMEEKELVCALKELVVKGHKCDNGFKSGYLNLLENSLVSKFPGTDLKGDHHINSKIYVWKKQYACLKLMLGVSGIGLNSTTFHIDALPEVWAAHIKVDPTARGLQKKTFPFYADWCEIFGNDRATAGGDKSFEVPAANEQSTADFSTFNVGESSSATKDKSKGLKRKQVDELAVQFINTMGGFCDRADSRFGNIASTMGTIAERVGSEFDAIKKRGKVFDMLELIKNLTIDDRVQISQFLCNNPKEMDLFFGLPDYAKTVLVKRIKKKLGEDE